MINLRCILILLFVVLLGCQEKVQDYESVLPFQDGIIIREIETPERSRISEYYYLEDGSYELVRGWDIFERKAPPDYNPVTGSLDPYISYNSIIKIVNKNSLSNNKIVELVCSISVNKPDGAEYTVLFSESDIEDLIRDSPHGPYTQNKSLIVKKDSLSFSDESPYCWLSTKGLFHVNVERSGGKVTNISTAHLGFIGIEEHIAVMAPAATD